MKRIYVSYRRDDTSESYGRIVERLRNYFGSEATLRSDSAYTADGGMVSSAEYRAYVAGAMKQCAALLLIIGPHWLQSDQPGGWSLSDLDDPVRIEIEAALRAGVPIVPALVQQGRMPTADELPASLRLLLEQDQEHAGKRGRESLLALVSRSGLQVRRDPDFGGDAQRLCEVIENLAGLEAASLERASGAINRTLRNVTLGASGVLIAHAIVLGYFALQAVVPLAPAFAFPAKWLPTVMLTSLIDWGVYFLAGYIAGRRTGDVGLGVSAAVTSYAIGLVAGMAIFADIAWSKWAPLTAAFPTPALLVGAPDWLLSPLLLLMRPFFLLFTILALGTPLGLAASFALGSLGGILGARVTGLASARQRKREREALMRSEAGDQRGLGAALLRNRATSHPALRRGATPAGKVFISYRRDDSAVMCGSIYDRMTEIFGVDTVFKDVDMIPVGVNFEKFISSTLEQCAAQVVVIGPRWVNIATAQGARRLDDPADFVRLEVETALRSGIKVIPALVQGATLPTADELPESLRPLADLQPLTVRYAPDFDGDMRDLGLALAPAIWPIASKQSLLKRATSLRVGPGATQTAAYFWLALFLAYGVILGVEAAHALSLPSVTREPSLLTFLGSAPVIMTLLAAISGAHLGYTTGRAGRAFWLALRAILAGCAALALTTQIRGAALFPSAFLAAQDPRFREFATGALIVAMVIALGPGLMAALLGAAGASFLRRRRTLSGLLSQAPRALQLLYREEDAAAGARISRGLVSYFGRQVLPPKQLRLQSAAPGASVTQRLAALVDARVLPLLRLRAVETRASSNALTASWLTRALRRTAALLVLVGPSWSASGDALASMGDPENPLRLRIEAALAVGRPIIPVLLTGATMPSPDQLPPSLREFAMLNAAWVRDDPDHSGDMRRLTRVIERLTRLREAQRALTTWAPLLAGATLSALALIGADALAARLVLNGYSQLGQTALMEAGAALVIVDLLVYGVASSLVTRWSGRRQNGALAAILGAALAMLVGAEALRHALASPGVNSGYFGSAPLDAQALGALALFLVIRAPFQTLGAIAASALGSFYGRIAYRGRVRSAQERRLYAMARAAIQSERLAEMSARSARATGDIATRPVAPEAAALAASAVGVTPEAGPPETPSPASGEAHAPGDRPAPDTESDSEETRREALRSEMQAARLRARKQTRIRLGMALGMIAITIVVVSVVARQTFQSQVIGISAEGTRIASQATAGSMQATATAVAIATVDASPFTPYVAAAPGPGCEPVHQAGTWSIDDTNPTAAVTCHPTFVTFTAGSDYGRPEDLRLTLSRPFVTSYTVEVDMKFEYPGTCAGLMTNGQSGVEGGEYEYQVCDNGSWRVYIFYPAAYDPIPLAHGSLPSKQASYHLAVVVKGSQRRFVVNGQTVKTFTDKRYSRTTYIAVCLNWSNFNNEVSADFSNFKYTPAT